MENRLKTLAAADGGPDLDQLVAAIARDSRGAALWHVLLSVAAQYPAPFIDKIGEILSKPALRDHPDLGHPIAALRAAVDPSAPPPAPLPVGGGYWSSAGDERDELRELGIDPGREGNAELLVLAAPIREFLERHRETAPSPADRAALRRSLQRLFDALATGSAADDATVDSAWGWTAEAAERLARSDLTPALLRLVREVLLAAARHRLPAAPAKGDSDRFSPSGFRAPRVAAAQGLTIVAKSKATLDAVARLARDPAPAVRFGVASRLNFLAAREPEAALRIARRRAGVEGSAPILEALVSSLSRMAAQGHDGALAAIATVEGRERRREEPSDSVLERASKELAAHAVWRDMPEGAAALRDLLRDPATNAPVVTAVLFALRDALIADDAAVRRRALAAFNAALDGAVRTLGELPDGRRETWPPEALERGRRAAEVADAVADQLYFASGVFQEGQGEQPGRHADAPRRARLYREAHDLLWRLASLGHPQIVHHLLELLAGCIDEDPSGVFALIATAITAGGAHGYQYESLAIDLVVAIVERYLAQYPEVFEDNDQATALMDVLDIFVAVGWPKARRLVYGLDELYR